MSVSKELLETLIRLEPAQEPNESLRKLLRQKVLSDIRKYEVISTTFQKKIWYRFYDLPTIITTRRLGS